MYNLPSIWAIWRQFSLLQHLFLLMLSGVSLYSLFSATIVMLRLRSLAHPVTNDTSLRQAVAALHERCTNVQQLIRATFYLFGLVLFLGLQWACVTLGHSSTPAAWLVLKNFEVDFAFAANVFLVLLVLHFVQWFASSRLHSHTRHLNVHFLT
jgi:hypothetical protein